MNDAWEGAGLWAVDECAVVLQATLVAFNTHGNGVHMYDNPGHASTVDLDCCNVFGNTPSNYGGLADDQTGVDGNLSVDPLFSNAAAGDFTLDAARRARRRTTNVACRSAPSASVAGSRRSPGVWRLSCCIHATRTHSTLARR